MTDDEVLKRFGFNLKVARMKKGVSQAQLAEILDVHEKYVSRIERGKQNVTLKTLNKLAKSIDIEIYKLLK